MTVQSNLECECLHCKVRVRGYSNRCENCGKWNTIRKVQPELPFYALRGGAAPTSLPAGETGRQALSLEVDAAQKALGLRPVALSDIDKAQIERVRSWEPFDEVMAGGFPRGTTILLDGAKGKGKSTVATHVCLSWPGRSVYVTAETGQGPEFVKARVMRIAPATLAPMTVLKIDRIDLDRWDAVETVLSQYSLIVVDSVQGFTPNYREQLQLVVLVGKTVAKTNGCALFLSRVNGRGEAAGWEELPHEVDACLSLVEAPGAHAELVATKNRNGALSGVLLGMRDSGMFKITSNASSANEEDARCSD